MESEREAVIDGQTFDLTEATVVVAITGGLNDTNHAKFIQLTAAEMFDLAMRLSGLG